MDEPQLTTPEKHSSLWLSTIFFILVIAIFSGLFFYFRTTIYNYAITIPEAEGIQNQFTYGPLPALANSDYFLKVKNQFIASKANFIEADLSTMQLRLYKDGEVIKEVPILTKGKEGSWWETPAGVYKIESKEQNHFSSIGKVYQPWSMIFQGNFFIHGWPYYPDGTPVATTYSGGCIRLNTDDAKAIYNLAAVGTPVLVYEKDFSHDTFQYQKTVPNISADQYLIADLKSDQILVEKGLETKAPIASVTKLITSLVAAEYIDLDRNIYITTSDIASTSKPRLKPGQNISVYSLMFPLLMESSNEAALAIASQLGKAHFVSLMNTKAGSLGMMASSFTDPAGSEATNISTPEDLFALAKYIYNNRSFIFKITSGTLTDSAYGTPVFKNLENFNIIPNAPTSDTFIGGKIGKTTAAEETYMGVFEISINGEQRPIVFIALHSQDAYTDLANMLKYVHSEYQ